MLIQSISFSISSIKTTKKRRKKKHISRDVCQLQCNSWKVSRITYLWYICLLQIFVNVLSSSQHWIIETSWILSMISHASWFDYKLFTIYSVSQCQSNVMDVCMICTATVALVKHAIRSINSPLSPSSLMSLKNADADNVMIQWIEMIL